MTHSGEKAVELFVIILLQSSKAGVGFESLKQEVQTMSCQV